MQISVHRDGENYVFMASFLHDDWRREIYSALLPRDCETEELSGLLLEMAGRVKNGEGKL